MEGLAFGARTGLQAAQDATNTSGTIKAERFIGNHFVGSALEATNLIGSKGSNIRIGTNTTDLSQAVEGILIGQYVENIGAVIAGNAIRIGSDSGSADFKIYVVNVTLGANWETTTITVVGGELKCNTCSKGTSWVGYQSNVVNYSQTFTCDPGFWASNTTPTLTGSITTNTATSGTGPQQNCP